MKFSRDEVADFLYREARLLDDRQWDEWLDCYAPTATFWMPAWDDDDRLIDDPQTEISLMYYPNRDGLEDRVFRLKTNRSGASMPEPRTCHFLSNLEFLNVHDGEDAIDLRFNWQTLSHRYKVTDSYFGTSYYTVDTRGSVPLIVSKKVVLKNDYIHQVLDIYHV